MNPPEQQEPVTAGAPLSSGTEILLSIETAREYLLRGAHPDGYWRGAITSDAGVTADYILMEAFLRRPRPEKIGKAANYVAGRQLAEGGWSLYEGGPVNIDASVKAYFALKLAGWSAEAPEMQRARQAVLALGGAQAAGVYTRFYLALFRQFEWSGVPAVPPEILFLPRFCYANMYDVSAWTRAMLVPLSIIWAHRPRRSIPDETGIGELFAGGVKERRHARLPRDSKWFSARNLLLDCDGILRSLDKLPVKPLRSRALRQAEKWMLERIEKSDGFGRTHPALMNAIMALDCLGYAHDHPILQHALKEFYALEVEDASMLRVQPLETPVADTALAYRALTEAGTRADHPALVKAVEWLRDRQALRPGDWRQKNARAEPGGWYSEFDNEFYPSVDTTALVLSALNRARLASHSEQDAEPVGAGAEAKAARPPLDVADGLEPAIGRGLGWLLSMQCSDGGFAAFDRDNNRKLLAHAPLAGHNAMLDGSCPDITGRALEAMAVLGRRKGNEAADRAIAYLRQAQESDGCWGGRWGVNGIYGTSCALRGLAVAGEDMHEGYVVRAIEWLRAVQNVDGGWGESCASYDDPDQKGIGPSSVTQTAWALMGFFAFADFRSTSVHRGIEFLLSKQTTEDTWDEPHYTGTRFPRFFYTRNDLHGHCFPLICLAEYARGTGLIHQPMRRTTAAGGKV